MCYCSITNVFSFHQMYVQDVALPSGSENNKKKRTRTQGNSSRSSMKSSHNDDRQGLSHVDSTLTEDVSGN